MTFRPIAAALALLAPVSLSAQQTATSAPRPQLTAEQATLLRCSAVFAIVSAKQAAGEKTASGYPALQERGREYFVRSGAKLMDELKLSRDEVRMLFGNEVRELQTNAPKGGIDALMPYCLLSLEASGL